VTSVLEALETVKVVCMVVVDLLTLQTIHHPSVLSGSAATKAIVTDVTANLLSEINFDTDLSASIASAGITAVTKVAVPVTALSNPDLNGVRAFEILSGSGAAAVQYLPSIH
jgi:hypothetical protein